MIIPGLFELLEKIVGPLLTTTAKSSIITGVLGGSGGTVEGLLGIVTGAIGKVEDEKIIELKGELANLLAQIQLDTVDEQSESFYKSGWRPFICWSLGIICTFHFALAELLNVLNACHYQTGLLAPMDSSTLFFFGSVLGIYMTGRSAEKVYNNIWNRPPYTKS